MVSMVISELKFITSLKIFQKLDPDANTLLNLNVKIAKYVLVSLFQGGVLCSAQSMR